MEPGTTAIGLIRENFSRDFRERVEAKFTKLIEKRVKKEPEKLWQEHEIPLNRQLLAYPYSIMDLLDVRFKEADKFFLLVYEDPTHTMRLEAGINHAFSKYRQNGHTKVRGFAILDDTVALLGVEKDWVETYLPAVVEPVDGNCYQLIVDARREQFIAEFIGKRLWEYFAGWDLSSFSDEELAPLSKLAPDQAEALKKFWHHRKFFILTGAPGTGKTYTLNKILQFYRGKALLVAPTGKAAQRMAEMTGRPASTIHRALGAHMEDGHWIFEYGAGYPLQCDLVIVDEFSMVDTFLAAKLFEAIGDHTDVLIVGDHHQLPSVGPGLVLRDLIEAGAPCVELTEIKRQSPGGIIEVCHDIKNSRGIDMGKMNKDDLFFEPGQQESEIMDTILDLYFDRLPKLAATSGWEGKLENIQILSPVKKDTYDLATKWINKNVRAERVVREQVVEMGAPKFGLHDRVIQLKNIYSEDQPDVFNGDVGTVVNIYKKGRTWHYKILFDIDNKEYDSTGENLDYAYALTIHKSQGSEWPAVIIPIHSSFGWFFERALMYTAISRASKACVLVGHRAALQGSAQKVRSLMRLTHLKERIKVVEVGA